ncbi:MAG: HIT domain-containing protein [Chloroflexi bacterium]|nr:HIT domain-containing protein [Chloroflexota bacterium]
MERRVTGPSLVSGGRRRLLRALGRAGLWVAQTAPGGRLVALACAHASRLLPVERVVETAGALVFRHPLPEARDHLVIVPKVALRDLCALAAGDRVDVWLALIAAARMAAARFEGERVLTVNVGARQQVAQLHAHLLPLAAARLLLGQVRQRVRIDLDSPVAARLALADATAALRACDHTLHGSLVIRGFETAGPGELLVCIAPREPTR